MAELNDVSAYKIFLAQAGVNPGGPIDAANWPEVKRLAMFSYASFLLGMQKYAYFHFAIGPGSYQNFTHFDYWNIDLGEPVAGPSGTYNVRQEIDGVKIYQREFEKGLVLVNPSNSRPPSLVALPNGIYSSLEGVGVNNVELPSQSGTVLLK